MLEDEELAMDRELRKVLGMSGRKICNLICLQDEDTGAGKILIQERDWMSQKV